MENGDGITLGLKRSDLSIGLVYSCLLSGMRILVIDIEKNPSPEKGKNYDVVWGRYFNDVTGKFDKVNIIDGQLVFLMDDDFTDEDDDEEDGY